MLITSILCCSRLKTAPEIALVSARFPGTVFQMVGIRNKNYARLGSITSMAKLNDVVEIAKFRVLSDWVDVLERYFDDISEKELVSTFP